MSAKSMNSVDPIVATDSFDASIRGCQVLGPYAKTGGILQRLEVSSIKRAEGHELMEQVTALTRATEKESWQ
jgi:hypothetical protein